MVRASIDLGTNTCLLLVADWDPQRSQVKRVIEDHSNIVRLGESVDRNREFKPEAMERTLRCLRQYSERLRSQGFAPEQTICVATSQARDAKNSKEFFSRIQNELGFRFQIISGEDEAKYTFLGSLLPGMQASQSIVVDIGGGSTEMITQDLNQSIDIGSVRFTERFLKSNPVTDPEFWACQQAIDENLEAFLPWRKANPGPLPLVAVAGTATTLAAWHLNQKKFDPSQIDQVTLTRGDIHRMVEELKWRTLQERQALPSMQPERADVILAGALILWRFQELLDFPECRISSRGLRYGILNLDPVSPRL